MLGLKGDFWGSQDLQVYGEAAVLGFKDYPLTIQGKGYDRIQDRIPVMGGVTLPTHPLIANGLFPAALSAFLIGIERDSAYWIDTDQIDSIETTVSPLDGSIPSTRAMSIAAFWQISSHEPQPMHFSRSLVWNPR